MFSGQGSQYFNMGCHLYEADPVFRESMNRCDEVVRRIRNESLLNVIYRPGARNRFAEFIDLRHTHPALFSVQYSLAQTLLHRGMRPGLLLGYSLGEMVAAAVGGALPLEAALEMLIEQAQLLTTMAPPGAMLAVLASPESFDPRDPLYADAWVAARNAPEHFVLSGLPAAIARIQRHLQARDVACCPLPVTVAFHSPLIDELERPFRERTRTSMMRELRFPLVSAAYVAQMTRLPPGFCWEAVRRPVNLQDTVAWLEARGGGVYVDLGPSGTLAAFLKYSLAAASSSCAYPIMTPFDRAGDTLRRIDWLLQEATREGANKSPSQQPNRSPDG
jgi:acyl transferase domain-containing protein